MKISAITSIEPMDLHTVYSVLSSNKLTDSQKTQYLRHNRVQIQGLVDARLPGIAFKGLMKNRPLQKFKFIKNSFTKRGDKILLAMTLGIEPPDVEEYIDGIVSKQFSEFSDLDFLDKDKLDAIKTYVYRHGSADGVVAFLDYELNVSNDKLKTLYRTLEYHTGGLADYFIRPVHRMSNMTMVRLYNVIDKHITDAKESGAITEEEYYKTAKWALIQIYQIQNNSKLINAIKTLKVLNG